ncbi:MAG: quinol:cytochrome c oxidoreductase quinone-binding subunit 1 [Acidobacteria bacterium]|jgi:Ni/Fe-hydrogenase subunit HybB-like protein|nr:quinol:cytochrome c oxidoreductase quinone-binding subunit 1 [Acidobacteriota bacterium]
MAHKDDTPVHEIRPVTQEVRVPERYLPTPTIEPGHSYASITDHISTIVLRKRTPIGWYVGFGISLILMTVLTAAIGKLVFVGVGIWGINHPAGWGMDIINFVWWIGIGHAGTLISAILLLLRQEWRTSINRFAEAMTLFAVASAGLYPALHTGRPWYDFWLFPYPNTMTLWPQFRSPLMWDVFAVSTYATVSALFWYVGLIPDLATLRDRATNVIARKIYGMGALGWRGSAKHWYRYETAYLLLAGLSTPLVLSVHTIVSFDFAVAQIPGWHATFFPPYFVAGAVFAGFAMVLTLAIPARKFLKLEDFITMKHLENMGKVMLATGLIVFYAYLMELFLGWYSGNVFERFMVHNRILGPYWKMYIALIVCNGLAPQLMWVKRFRTSTAMLFITAMFVNVGMWLERFVIIPGSLHRDFLPSSWGMYHGTRWDWSMFIGSMGLFLFLLFLFIRFLPMISIFEMRTLLPEAHAHGEEH